MEAGCRRCARRRQGHVQRGQGQPDAGRSRHRHLRTERGAIDLRDLRDRHTRPRRRGGGDRRGNGGVLPALPVVPRGVQEAEHGRARRLDELGLSPGLHDPDKVARRSQGQARARNRRQCRADARRRRRGGGCHAGGGRQPVAARRHRLSARYRRLAAGPSVTAISSSMSPTIRWV